MGSPVRVAGAPTSGSQRAERAPRAKPAVDKPPQGDAVPEQAAAAAKQWERKAAARRKPPGEHVRLGADGALAFAPALKGAPRDGLLEQAGALLRELRGAKSTEYTFGGSVTDTEVNTNESLRRYYASVDAAARLRSLDPGLTPAVRAFADTVSIPGDLRAALDRALGAEASQGSRSGTMPAHASGDHQEGSKFPVARQLPVGTAPMSPAIAEAIVGGTYEGTFRFSDDGIRTFIGHAPSPFEPLNMMYKLIARNAPSADFAELYCFAARVAELGGVVRLGDRAGLSELVPVSQDGVDAVRRLFSAISEPIHRWLKVGGVPVDDWPATMPMARSEGRSLWPAQVALPEGPLGTVRAKSKNALGRLSAAAQRGENTDYARLDDAGIIAHVTHDTGTGVDVLAHGGLRDRAYELRARALEILPEGPLRSKELYRARRFLGAPVTLLSVPC